MSNNFLAACSHRHSCSISHLADEITSLQLDAKEDSFPSTMFRSPNLPSIFVILLHQQLCLLESRELRWFTLFLSSRREYQQMLMKYMTFGAFTDGFDERWECSLKSWQTIESMYNFQIPWNVFNLEANSNYETQQPAVLALFKKRYRSKEEVYCPKRLWGSCIIAGFVEVWARCCGLGCFRWLGSGRTCSLVDALIKQLLGLSNSHLQNTP